MSWTGAVSKDNQRWEREGGSQRNRNETKPKRRRRAFDGSFEKREGKGRLRVMVRLTSSEVSSRRVLVSLHDREPFRPRDVVGVNGCLASFEDRDGFLGSHEDGETWRDSESFLGGSDDDLIERREARREKRRR